MINMMQKKYSSFILKCGSLLVNFFNNNCMLSESMAARNTCLYLKLVRIEIYRYLYTYSYNLKLIKLEICCGDI